MSTNQNIDLCIESKNKFKAILRFKITVYQLNLVFNLQSGSIDNKIYLFLITSVSVGTFFGKFNLQFTLSKTNSKCIKREINCISSEYFLNLNHL